ncbi:MAG: EutP/PduV family microcompartment system protein [Clostridia bacterium]|nr:EutP/PduV family microcompartment system protein [Clostridia bacterium]
MKKIIFMGKSRSGKTTLCQKLHDMAVSYRKTQAVEQYLNAIDTPGEYLENRHYYSALIISAADAKVIGVVSDATEHESYIPPAFAMTFSRPVIGIVTKVGIADEKQIKKAEQALKNGGITKIFKVDSILNIGLKLLFDYLEEV